MKYIPLKYIKEDAAVGNADSSEDARESTGMLERLVAELRGQLAELSPNAEGLRRADLLLQLGRALVRLENQEDAWAAAREAFDLYAGERSWEGAVQASDILFLSDQPASLAALGQGIWLAVTYPVDPELSCRAAAARCRRNATGIRRRGGGCRHGVLCGRPPSARTAARTPSHLRQSGPRHRGAPP